MFSLKKEQICMCSFIMWFRAPFNVCNDNRNRLQCIRYIYSTMAKRKFASFCHFHSHISEVRKTGAFDTRTEERYQKIWSHPWRNTSPLSYKKGFYNSHLPYSNRKMNGFRMLHLGSSLYDKTEWDDPESEDEVVNVIYVDQMGKETRVRGKVGDNILYLAHRYSIGIEGACDAKVACSTCHVYVDEDSLAKLEEMELSEEDMLDAAPFLKPSSRLGCQIILRKDLDGIRITLPLGTKNAYVDGHTPHTH